MAAIEFERVVAQGATTGEHGNEAAIGTQFAGWQRYEGSRPENIARSEITTLDRFARIDDGNVDVVIDQHVEDFINGHIDGNQVLQALRGKLDASVVLNPRRPENNQLVRRELRRIWTDARAVLPPDEGDGDPSEFELYGVSNIARFDARYQPEELQAMADNATLLLRRNGVEVDEIPRVVVARDLDPSDERFFTIKAWYDSYGGAQVFVNPLAAVAGPEALYGDVMHEVQHYATNDMIVRLRRGADALAQAIRGTVFTVGEEQIDLATVIIEGFTEYEQRLLWDSPWSGGGYRSEVSIVEKLIEAGVSYATFKAAYYDVADWALQDILDKARTLDLHVSPRNSPAQDVPPIMIEGPNP